MYPIRSAFCGFSIKSKMTMEVIKKDTNKWCPFDEVNGFIYFTIFMLAPLAALIT